MSACSSLLIVVCYLVVQMVGAGKLIELMFGVPYLEAVLSLGVLMLVYVALGGMLATTWMQIIKAGLMLGCGLTLAFGVLAQSDFSLATLMKHLSPSSRYTRQCPRHEERLKQPRVFTQIIFNNDKVIADAKM